MNITSGSPIEIIVIRLKNIIKTIESEDLGVKTNINVILYYMTNSKNLPYRKGVGMMIINRESKVFVGKRIDTKTRGWQMPQGGMNTGETPSRAVFREMKEELGTSKGEIIAESKYWYSYDLPEFLIPRLWDGAYKGQKQKWFLIRYTGSDEDINIKTATPEFYEWGWVDIDDLPVMIVHFKKKLYNAVLREFKSLI